MPESSGHPHGNTRTNPGNPRNNHPAVEDPRDTLNAMIATISDLRDSIIANTPDGHQISPEVDNSLNFTLLLVGQAIDALSGGSPYFTDAEMVEIKRLTAELDATIARPRKRRYLIAEDDLVQFATGVYNSGMSDATSE